MERMVLPVGVNFPKSALEVSIEFDKHLKSSGGGEYLPTPTGFEELDAILGGGLHPESLTLVGGPPGVGKTVFVLQAARNVAASGKAVACVVCFEHSEVHLYHRLMCLESFLCGEERDPITLNAIRNTVTNAPGAGLQTLLETLPAVQFAWKGILEYWERLYMVKGHPLKTTLNVLDSYLAHLQTISERVVLFVDYLQKVPVVSPGYELRAEKQIRIVTEGLKHLAMAHRVPIVAVAASDLEGLKNEKARFQDLWGGSSVQYEPDIAMMLNRGSDRNILFAIEKNRLGPAGSIFSLRLRGESFAFNATPKEFTSAE